MKRQNQETGRCPQMWDLWTLKGFNAAPYFHLIDYEQKEKKRLDFFWTVLTKNGDG
jgi:hypothetical protein